MMISEGLSTEVIEHQVLRRNTEIVEHLLFFAYFLSVFRIVPEIRVFHFLINFFEPTFLLVDVKDTP